MLTIQTVHRNPIRTDVEILNWWVGMVVGWWDDQCWTRLQGGEADWAQPSLTKILPVGRLIGVGIVAAEATFLVL